MKSLLKYLFVLCFFSLFAYSCRNQTNKDSGDGIQGHCLDIIPFEQIDNLIYLPVSVNGSKPLRFILDGGASVCVIDPTQVTALGLKTEGNGKISGAGSGSVDVTYTDSVNFSLPGIKINVPKATIINLANAVPGQKIDGLIGYDFFAQYVVEINYQTNTIRLFDPGSFSYTGKGAVVPFVLKKKLIYVHGKIKVAGQNAVENDYLVDTGSADVINDNIVASATTPKTDAVGGVGIGKQFKIVVGDVETFQIGNLTLKNLKGVSGGTKIGAGLLRSYTVIFDYSRKEMILE